MFVFICAHVLWLFFTIHNGFTKSYKICMLYIISREQEMYSEYGDVYGTSIMGEDELVICDPRVYDTVLVSYSYVYYVNIAERSGIARCHSY